jgi:hypothetical protein
MSEAYWRAFYAARLRRHRARWSWTHMRVLCGCGAPLPCDERRAIMAEALGTGT